VKVLVIYDSVSNAKVTAKVAEAVVASLRGKGVTVDSFFVEDSAKANVKDYDCLVLGAPTMAWRPSKRMKEYISGLAGNEFSGKKAAAFDTQMKSAVSGNATKHMEKSLKALGFSIPTPSLISYVFSENKQYKLREGEIEKAKAWGAALAAALTK